MNDIIEVLKYAKEIGSLTNLILTIVFISFVIILCGKGYKEVLIPLKKQFLKEHDEQQEKEETIKLHNQEIDHLRLEMLELQTQMNDKFNEIKEMNNQIMSYNTAQTKVIETQIRHSLVCGVQNAINKGYVTSSELRSLEELNEVYRGDLFKGNSYVHILMRKVESLEIIPDGTEDYINYIKEKTEGCKKGEPV